MLSKERVRVWNTGENNGKTEVYKWWRIPYVLNEAHQQPWSVWEQVYSGWKGKVTNQNTESKTMTTKLILGADCLTLHLNNHTMKMTTHLINLLISICQTNFTFSCNTKPPGPPVITIVTALNGFSAALFWTTPPYNCSLNYYLLEISDE